MQRVDAPEILDSDTCSNEEVEIVMRDLGMVNRWFGGVATTQKMLERVAQSCGAQRLSLLEVAAGSGELSRRVQQNLARRGIALDITLLDRARSHLADEIRTGPIHTIVGDGLTLPFSDRAFDVVSCNLFAHHLDAQQLPRFVREGWRVSRHALLINDLVRHPLHLGLVYASRPIMRSRIAWLDGVTSVRRAYVPDEMQSMIASALSSQDGVQIEITRHYLYRMGVIVWKGAAETGRHIRV
jgi:ubiquinone/menaquinone biosynthesis C-methylase UbiE